MTKKKPWRDYLFRGLQGLYGALNLIDTVETLNALNKGAKEANPLMAPLAKAPPLLAVIKGLWTYKALKELNDWYKDDPTAALWTLGAMNAIQGAVDWHNWRQLRRLK